jgi:N-acetylmuramoyl-L-alanine amidase
MRKASLFILVLFCLLICNLHASQKKVNIKVMTDSKVYKDVQLLLVNGMGYLRVSDVCDILKAKMNYYKSSRKVVFRLKKREINLFVNSPKVIIDGIERKMNKKTMVVDNEIWMPLELIITRAFSGFAGVAVNWDFLEKTLSLGAQRPYSKFPEVKVSPPVVPLGERKIKKIKVIVIDPGHGGKDPGAIGPRGVKEKDVVLRLSRRLAKELRKRFKVKVFLTREDDRFIPLRERANFANRVKADLFVSVHTNASLNPRARGFEIYYLSEKASDADAQAAENLENSVLALEGGHKSSEVDKILWALALTENMNESSEICGLICRKVNKIIGIENKGVKQAGFYVLRGVKMPSVLIEAAFISNPVEERNLRRGPFSGNIVKAVCEGVGEYRTLASRWQ